MKDRLRHILAIVTMLVFVNFVFSNTVCIHTHSDGDNSYTHSHPYLPSSHHSHSQAAVNLIAGFNATAAAFQGVASLNIQQPVATISTTDSFFITEISRGSAISLSLRDPPECLLS